MGFSHFFCSRVLIITITTASPWRDSCFSPRYYKGRVKYCRAETKYELSNEGSSGSSNFFKKENEEMLIVHLGLCGNDVRARNITVSAPPSS